MQPRDGHRAGFDALVLAATLSDGATGRLLDMGAGTGLVGFAALDRHPALRADLAERDPVMLAALQETLRHPRNGALAPRARVTAVDLATAAAEREGAGLTPGVYAHALANPPFNPAARRPSPDGRRAAAHAMPEGLLDAWCRAAAHALAPGGTLTVILRPESLPALLAAWRGSAGGRFGGPTLRPVHTREGAATRLLARGSKGARTPLALRSALHVDAAFRAALADGTARVEL